MFGRDQLVLSKPGEIKTVAKSFTDNFRKIASMSKNSESVQKRVPPVTTESRQTPVQSVTKQRISGNDLREIQLEIRKNSIKLEVVKSYATDFMQKVNKLEEINGKVPEGKIIYSYSDNRGSWGNLENKGEKLKIIIKKKSNKEFEEEQIDIYNLSSYDIKPSGVYVQVKGWGNLKELSLLNAIKNSGSKFKTLNNGKSKEWIIFSYAVSSISSLADGGWECKVRVIPGKEC